MPINNLEPLPPFWFRFTDKEDAKKYGDDWHKYDESALITLPAQTLIDIEDQLPGRLSIPAAMNYFRRSSVIGDTFAMWVAFYQEGKKIDFDDFNPQSMQAEWTEKEPAPKEVAVEKEPLSEPDGSWNSTSEKTDTVALPNLPIVG